MSRQQTFDRLRYLEAAARGAPIDLHYRVLFGQARINGQPFAPLCGKCFARTGTTVAGVKLFRRLARALNLALYFEESLKLAGPRIELGVLRGFSALLMAEIGRLHRPGYTGQDLHLVDSFQGLSQPTSRDAIGERAGPGQAKELVFAHAAGHFAVAESEVRKALAEFPEIAIHAGWVPEILAALPESRWAFVHIDLDLYEPMRGALEYFVPRLVPGGILVNDDYDSPIFPGAGRAWDEYLGSRGLPFIALDTGQAVHIGRG
ncbi:MAG: hypothetical protein FJX57_24910 [Alphaproteobacteria bacterium]|nr:hypothetical protein [Alphaproteobacteria bacterium]